MIIQISESLRIAGGEHCWALQRPRRRNGRRIWTPFKHYTKLGQALVQAGEREIRLSEGHSLADAIGAFTRVAHRYEQLLDISLCELKERAEKIEGRAA